MLLSSVSTPKKHAHLSTKSSKEVDNACVTDGHRYETSNQGIETYNQG